MTRPLDDQPDDAIVKRARAVRGEVVNYSTPPDSYSEDPSPEDVARFSSVTVVCPGCRTELPDDVDVCWNCNEPVGVARRDEKGPPWWIIALALALVLLLLFLISF